MLLVFRNPQSTATLHRILSRVANCRCMKSTKSEEDKMDVDSDDDASTLLFEKFFIYCTSERIDIFAEFHLRRKTFRNRSRSINWFGTLKNIRKPTHQEIEKGWSENITLDTLDRHRLSFISNFPVSPNWLQICDHFFHQSTECRHHVHSTP